MCEKSACGPWELVEESVHEPAGRAKQTTQRATKSKELVCQSEEQTPAPCRMVAASSYGRLRRSAGNGL